MFGGRYVQKQVCFYLESGYLLLLHVHFVIFSKFETIQYVPQVKYSRQEGGSCWWANLY